MLGFINDLVKLTKDIESLSKDISYQAEETVASIKRNGFALDDLRKSIDTPKCQVSRVRKTDVTCN